MLSFIFPASAAAISALHACGVKEHIWFRSYCPEGIKGDFKTYLKEKVRNLNKTRMTEEATKEFVEEFTAHKLGLEPTY